MTEEVLDVQLPGLVLDRPGGERVPEPMGVDLGDAGLPPQAAQHLLHAVVLQRPVAARIAEHWPWPGPPESLDGSAQCIGRT